MFQSPLQLPTLQRIGTGDAVLFLENSVLCLLKKGMYSSELNQMLTTNRLFALISDLETRGISIEELVSGIVAIDYSDWVNLTTEHPSIQSWF
jgi:tRNA 2-thiouridine synthesizing protein B